MGSPASSLHRLIAQGRLRSSLITRDLTELGMWDTPAVSLLNYIELGIRKKEIYSRLKMTKYTLKVSVLKENLKNGIEFHNLYFSTFSSFYVNVERKI